MFSFLFSKKLHSAKREVRGTTVAELRDILATADGEDEVTIYADVEGEWVSIPPYSDKRAAICGYFAVAGVNTVKGMAVLTTGAEAAL